MRKIRKIRGNVIEREVESEKVKERERERGKTGNSSIERLVNIYK